MAQLNIGSSASYSDLAIHMHMGDRIEYVRDEVGPIFRIDGHMPMRLYLKDEHVESLRQAIAVYDLSKVDTATNK